MNSRRDLRRELVDPALGGVQPRLHRVEVEHAVALDHDLAVERRARRQELAERLAAPGSSGAAAARCATRAGARRVAFSSSPRKPSHFGSYCQPSPSGSSRTSSASIGGNGTAASSSGGRSTGSRRIALRRAMAVNLPRGSQATTLSLSCDGSPSPGSERSRRSGSTRRSTWEAAVAGRSGVDWIRVVRRERVPGADRGRGEGLRARRRSSGRRTRAGSSATSCSPSPPRARRGRDAGVDGVDPARAGILVGSAIGGVIGVLAQNDVLARARARPGLAVVPAERPRRLGERPDRDRPRPPRPELRARLGLRDGLARGRRGRRADPPRRRRRRARRRHRVVHAPAHPRRLLRDARSRRRGGGPDAGVAAVRRDAGGVRDGRGRVRAPARGARARAGARRADVRRGARLRDVERRAPHGAARPGVGRAWRR